MNPKTLQEILNELTHLKSEINSVQINEKVYSVAEGIIRENLNKIERLQQQYYHLIRSIWRPVLITLPSTEDAQNFLLLATQKFNAIAFDVNLVPNSIYKKITETNFYINSDTILGSVEFWILAGAIKDFIQQLYVFFGKNNIVTSFSINAHSSYFNKPIFCAIKNFLEEHLNFGLDRWFFEKEIAERALNKNFSGNKLLVLFINFAQNDYNLTKKMDIVFEKSIIKENFSAPISDETVLKFLKKLKSSKMEVT